MNEYKQLSSLIETLELSVEEQFDLSIIEGEDISVSQYEMLRNLEGAETLSVLKEIKSLLLQLGQPVTQPTEQPINRPRKRTSYFTMRFIDHRDAEGFAILEDKHKVIEFIEMITKLGSKVSGIFYTNLETNTFTKVKLIEYDGQLILAGVSR